jgi:hypothetical protein
MNWIKLSGFAMAMAVALIAAPATALESLGLGAFVAAEAPPLLNDPPPPPPSPGEGPLPLPLPVGSQGVPPGAEVYCPGLPWIHDCHQCVADPAHRCWNR